MKQLNFPTPLSIVLIFLATFFFSCTEKGCPDVKAYNFGLDIDPDSSLCAYPNVSIDLRYTFGENNSLPLNTPLLVDTFRLSISGVWIYLSDVGLTYGVHGSLALSDTVLLATPGASNQLTAPAFGGYFNQVTLNFGVPASLNHPSESQFSQYPPSHPLGIQNPPMFFDSTQGYIFLRIEGEVDTDGNDTVDTSLLLLVGQDAFGKSISVSAQQQITTESHLISLDFDIEKVLEGIDLRNQYFTNSVDSIELATDIADNMDGAFRVR